MIFEHLKTFAILYGPVILIVGVASHLTRNYFNRGLHKYPGPFLCAITNWLRFFKAWQRAPEQWHIDLHNKHGDIVRLGPNCLSFGNPKAIKVIYALGKGFTKVNYLISYSCVILSRTSPIFILSRWQRQRREKSFQHSLVLNQKSITLS